MSPTHGRWRSIEELYEAVIALPAGQRAAFLEKSCRDEQLRRRVESLLDLASNGDPLLKKSAPAQSVPLGPGADLGPYRVGERLGAGGMGEVYRARDSRLDRLVALKILPAGVSGDPVRRQRFEQEARAASALNHPNILSVFDTGEYNGWVFMVTELIEGEPLRESLRRGPLPISRVI